MRLKILPVALLAALAAPCQPPVRRTPWPADGDYSDLFDRVKASDYVAVVKVTKLDWILGRQSSEQIEQLRQAEARKDSSGLAPVRSPSGGGPLYTLSVTRTVCRQGDFRMGGEESQDIAGPFHIFLPWKEVGYTHTDSEHLVLGDSYLVFLRKDPAETLASSYDIDTIQAYYRAHQGERGAILLPPEATGDAVPRPAKALLSAVTSLCDAARPANSLSKISNLTALSQSTGDAGLRRSAEAALRALAGASDGPAK